MAEIIRLSLCLYGVHLGLLAARSLSICWPVAVRLIEFLLRRLSGGIGGAPDRHSEISGSAKGVSGKSSSLNFVSGSSSASENSV